MKASKTSKKNIVRTILEVVGVIISYLLGNGTFLG